MLSKDEYCKVTTVDGQHYILCERLDMFPDVEQELLSGTVISVRCASTEECAQQWLREYETVTKTTFSVMATAGEKSKNAWVLHHKRVRCHHYSRTTASKTGKVSARDTGCRVVLHFRVRRVAFENHTGSRSKKPDAGYALKVQSTGVAHNHALDSPALLKFRRVSEPTRERLIGLFRHRHTPATALQALKVQLQSEHGDRYPTVAADRAVLPSRNYVHRLHQQVLASDRGNLSTTSTLKKQLKGIQTDSGGTGDETSSPAPDLETDPSHLSHPSHPSHPSPTDPLLTELQQSLCDFSQHVLEQASEPGQRLETWHRAVGTMTSRCRGMSAAARLSAVQNFGGVSARAGRYGTPIGTGTARRGASGTARRGASGTARRGGSGTARRGSVTSRGRGRACPVRPTNSRPVGEHDYTAAAERRPAAPVEEESPRKSVEEITAPSDARPLVTLACEETEEPTPWGDVTVLTWSDVTSQYE